MMCVNVARLKIRVVFANTSISDGSLLYQRFV